MAEVFKKLYFDLPGFGRVHAMPGGQFQPEGENRAGVASDLGPVGPEGEYAFGELQFELPNIAGISLKALGALKDANVTVQDDGGKPSCWNARPSRWRSGGDLIALAPILRRAINRFSSLVGWTQAEMYRLTLRDLILLDGDLACPTRS